jgi:hypothetical protein
MVAVPKVKSEYAPQASYHTTPHCLRRDVRLIEDTRTVFLGSGNHVGLQQWYQEQERMVKIHDGVSPTTAFHKQSDFTAFPVCGNAGAVFDPSQAY